MYAYFYRTSKRVVRSNIAQKQQLKNKILAFKGKSTAQTICSRHGDAAVRIVPKIIVPNNRFLLYPESPFRTQRPGDVFHSSVCFIPYVHFGHYVP